MNNYRLRTGKLFNREEEKDKEPPKRIVFLSVEGNVTECQYFKWLDKHKNEIGINSIVYVHVLSRGRKDTRSAPADVIELLEEYMTIRSGDMVALLKPLLNGFTEEFIKQYIVDPDKLPKKDVKLFEQELLKLGIDMHYHYFLNRVHSDNDIFGVVLDRDYKNHSVEELKNVIESCEEKGYRFFISNPCFELWLLLHVCDVKTELKDNMGDILSNDKISNKHTYVSGLLHDKAGRSKEITENDFVKHYLPNIDKAIDRANGLSKDIRDLSGLNTPEDERGMVGTNVQEIIGLLKENGDM